MAFTAGRMIEEKDIRMVVSASQEADIFAMIDAARARSLKALREFLALLVRTGYSLYGLPVPKTVDVDYPEDIQKAEAYLKEIGREAE